MARRRRRPTANTQASGSTWYALGASMSPTPKGPPPIDTPAPSNASTPKVETPTIAPPPPPAPAPAPPPVQRNAQWWSAQFASDPRFLRLDPVLRGQQNQIGQNYGLYINRDEQGRQLYKTASGATGITQGYDDQGNLVYRDAAGTVYKPSDLQLDVRSVKQGEAGYLESQLGSTQAQSERKQYQIGDASAQAGARRSGMRASTSAAETSALQAALANLATRAAGEYAGVDKSYADLYTDIYGDLIKNAGDLVAPGDAPAPEAPAPEAPSVPAGSVAVPGGGSANAAGQYTPPPAGSTLSPRAFENTLNEILGPASQRGPQPMTKADRISALRNVYDSYELTPQQRNRVKAELKKLGFVIR